MGATGYRCLERRLYRKADVASSSRGVAYSVQPHRTVRRQHHLWRLLLKKVGGLCRCRALTPARSHSAGAVGGKQSVFRLNWVSWNMVSARQMRGPERQPFPSSLMWRACAGECFFSPSIFSRHPPAPTSVPRRRNSRKSRASGEAPKGPSFW